MGQTALNRVKGDGIVLRRLRLLGIAVLLAVPTVGAFASPAQACNGEICDGINWLCNNVKVLPDDCVR